MTSTSDPQRALVELMDGFLRTQLLYVATTLGVPDLLARGPRTSADLATATGAVPGPLHRVLRGLAAAGVLVEDGGGFGLTPIGDLLRSDRPGSQRGPVLARGALYYVGAGALLDGVGGGGIPFEAARGMSLFEYLDDHPDERAAFDGSMRARAVREAGAVAACLDVTRHRRVIDVGGGAGVLLEALLAQAPGVCGVLFDRPEAIEQARGRLATSPAAGRCELVGGDFFAGVPAGGDLYLLSRVLHDWDDEAAETVLASCRRAMGEDGRLVVVEAVLPERAADDPAAITMDLYMLVLLGGRERTAREFEALLAAAGFRLDAVTATAAGVSVLEATPV